MNINVAIDGPAGAGKSTIAKKVAKDLGFIYVDTGAMYRSMALYVIREGLDYNDREVVEEECKTVSVDICYFDGEQQVLLNGENVTTTIRQEQVGNVASTISSYPLVREKLVDLQRVLAQKENVIMDGRDIGTVVLPNANVKIYLTASSAVRAKRRYEELMEKGISCDLKEIEQDIITRDERDMNREVSPLRQAEDAILLDTSNMNIDMVVKEIKNIIDKA